MTRETSYLREEWQDPNLPITGPAPKARRTVGVLHYSGSNSIPADKPAWLRSMQADYVNNRGYSLGYGYLVVGDGSDYEIRGADFNMASNNGDKVDGNANDWTLSILLDVTTSSGATNAAIATCRRIFAEAGITARPVPHSFYDYTACCGDTVRAQIDAGLFDPSPDYPPTEPEPEPVPPPQEETPMSAPATTTDSNGDPWAVYLIADGTLLAKHADDHPFPLGAPDGRKLTTDVSVVPAEGGRLYVWVYADNGETWLRHWPGLGHDWDAWYQAG